MSFQASQHMSFVTVTNLDDFKSKENVRKVRTTVMNDYLDKAKEDPLTTDRRAFSKTTPAKKQHVSTQRRPRHRPILPISQSGPSQHDQSSKRTPSERSLGSSKHTANITTSPSSLESTSPRVHMQLRQDSAVSIKEETIAPATSSCSTVFLNEVNDPSVELERHLESFNLAQGALVPAAIDIQWLRNNCARFFRTQGAARRWFAVLIHSPLAYLARLCLTAPFTDLMVSQTSSVEGFSDSDTRLTLEIFDVIPRIINDTLNDPLQQCSNSTMLAIVQLLYGQLYTSYRSLIGSHQFALRQMILARGGLEKLDGNGPVAVGVTMVHLEANFLRNKEGDLDCLNWILVRISDSTAMPWPAPEGPLLRIRDDNTAAMPSSLHSTETNQLIGLMQDLTHQVLQLRKIEVAQTIGSTVAVAAYAEQKAKIYWTMADLTRKVHQTPARTRVYTGVAAWAYEAVRQASFLYSHAIWERRPFHQPVKCTQCVTLASPEKLFDAVRRIPIGDLWGPLAGTLYWALMVGAATCHQIPQGTDGERSDIQTNTPILPSDLVPPLPYSFTHERQISSSTTVDLLDQLLNPPEPHQAGSEADEAGPQALVSPVDLTSAPKEFFILEQRTLNAAKELFDSYAQTRPHDRCSQREVDAGRPFVQRCEDDKSAKRHRVLPTNADPGREEGRAVEHADFIRCFLTANAIRVSLLLRFDHEIAMLRSVATLDQVAAWLRRE
ncbi:hypothetical protein BDZ85DRAFT_127216 [Elsinoe ampelina]|uniref:Uncharacterized protein n=1 Tax=Elsinoe ampelina TaxID=302913 RepID=A0A6A6G9E1_9PEZI|nr:hypothetical protein BDZ85DRAFT_127216 [Elsinoe ampelina]